MKNKRVTIYIKPEDWKKVRVESVERGVSLGEYLMGFWGGEKKPAKELVESPVVIPVEREVEKSEVIEDWRMRIKPMPKGV